MVGCLDDSQWSYLVVSVCQCAPYLALWFGVFFPFHILEDIFGKQHLELTGEVQWSFS